MLYLLTLRHKMLYYMFETNKGGYFMISLAVQKGSTVYVYNERNQQIMCKLGTLYGYTSAIVSIQNAGRIYTYNEKGMQISVR